MRETSKQAHSDLQTFIEQFEPRKFKVLANGIEVRGIVDLHRAVTEAKNLISRFNLNLSVSHTAEMLSYRGFEVNYIAEN
ncbi:MAG: hypothetical protein REI64_11450 [Pedobacter sp.]|uniref:hypothetical protein n=1 Tax=Pedobacter sp. TaxID=1411316 RepID=UPI0028094B43|nr:hypothetical protein [Pedobacter sp.]MDQ8005406.1 hypothetical protein [Pedobacter sp.]